MKIASFPLFIARRIYSDPSPESGGRVSKPAITIALAGIAVGLAVMILSIAVAMGFKREVKEKVTGFAAHIQVANYSRSGNLYETRPIAGDDSLRTAILQSSAGISHVQRYTMKPGMWKTRDNFQGIILKGIGQEYDTTFLSRHLIAGRIPLFTDSVASGEILVSKVLADKLGVRTGDRITTYFVQENVRARRFTVCGIYQTNFAEYDNRFLITDLYTAGRLNGWKDPSLVSGMEVAIRPGADLEACTARVGQLVNRRTDRYGNAYLAQSIEQLYPSIFAWLEVLDTNVLVIIILMTGVAGFTMISGLLILILERTNMIGVLKALGAADGTIRRIFLLFAVFLIGRGLLWGNLIGIGLCLLQQSVRLIRLDPTTYYVDAVPVLLDIPMLLLLNLSTLVISVAMLLGPSLLISRIRPAEVMRFE